MKRVLPALVVAVAVIMGGIPAAGTLAATTRRTSHLHSQPLRPLNDHSAAHSGGWTMTRPDISIYTTMVVPHNDVAGAAIAKYALSYVGYPYTLIGNAPSLGFSCIGLVSYVYQSFGIPLPDDLWNARAYAPAVSFGELRPGDILWFGNTVWAGLSHTAIYIGGGRFVHAAWFGIGVIVSSFRNDPRYGDYWTSHYLGASRPWGGAGASTPLFASAVDAVVFPAVQTLPHDPVMLVTAPVQRLRRWWALSAPIERVVPQATPLIPLQRQGDWYQVVTPDGVTGWIATSTRVRNLAVGTPITAADVSARLPARRTHRRTARHTVHRRVAAHHPSPAHRAGHGLASARDPARAHHRSRRHAVATHHGRAPRSHRRTAVPARRSTAGRSVVPHVTVHRHRTPHVRSQARSTQKTITRIRLLMRHGWRVHLQATVRLHVHPGFNAIALRLLRQGSELRVLGGQGNWLHVRLPAGTQGYVLEQYVQ